MDIQCFHMYILQRFQSFLSTRSNPDVWNWSNIAIDEFIVIRNRIILQGIMKYFCIIFNKVYIEYKHNISDFMNWVYQWDSPAHHVINTPGKRLYFSRKNFYGKMQQSCETLCPMEMTLSKPTLWGIAQLVTETQLYQHLVMLVC